MQNSAEIGSGRSLIQLPPNTCQFCRGINISGRLQTTNLTFGNIVVLLDHYCCLSAKLYRCVLSVMELGAWRRSANKNAALG